MHRQTCVPALDPGQQRSDVPVLAIQGEPALRVVPGEPRQTTVYCRNGKGRDPVRTPGPQDKIRSFPVTETAAPRIAPGLPESKRREG